ncbi:MAG: class I SAM-dependent methyltransferase [Yoonia sp.]|uniref:class I SAM-dependent methyltransferase n=1 Tax=Yoonia sp. TaxID=2212373 RepID=UPI00273E2C45|nr:class I SAM-dependent methyltransferase [Yoonia sp.]MDP5087031.1 class I SAM-dependent methyltransferase [Yoonia sp.]
MSLDAARQYLLGDGSDALIAFMAAQSVDLAQTGDTSLPKARAVELGWLDPVTEQRTATGIFVSDSCREYLFWQKRDRKLPFENTLAHLGRAVFKDKHVCEIGAGMGANLMSLATTNTKLCGVEPVDAYIVLGDIFREREGLEPIEIRIGGAEALPFEADEVDLILLVSAHQYFDIHLALKEIARVLRPGGELILIGGTLWPYFTQIGRQVIAGKSSPKDFLITVTNTLSYMAFGRRIIPSRSGFSTARPVYPTRAAMKRWMRAAGFEQVVEPDSIEDETCFFVKQSGIE